MLVDLLNILWSFVWSHRIAQSSSMAATTDKNPVSTIADSLGTSEISSPTDDFHHVRRGQDAGDLSVAESIDGYDAERMRARTALTAEEEKKLLRRIDWHLMPICSLIFMFKNLDSDNVGRQVIHGTTRVSRLANAQCADLKRSYYE